MIVVKQVSRRGKMKKRWVFWGMLPVWMPGDDGRRFAWLTCGEIVCPASPSISTQDVGGLTAQWMETRYWRQQDNTDDLGRVIAPCSSMLASRGGECWGDCRERKRLRSYFSGQVSPVYASGDPQER